MSHNIIWTKDIPTEPGFYLRKKTTEWVVTVTSVVRGRWQDAQNPESLYSGFSKVSLEEDDTYYWWYGPIPSPPH